MEKTLVIKTIRHWPTRILVLFLHTVQATFLNYYLISHLGNQWAGVIAGDVIVGVIFIVAMVMAQKNFVAEKLAGPSLSCKDSRSLPFAYIGWLCYAIMLNVKVIVIMKAFAKQLHEHAFFGFNTLKTTIAIDGIVFVSFLATQHNALPGTPRRSFIDELTATVLFDVLDGVDSLEILLDEETRETIPLELEDAVIAICCLTFLLPTVPMFTLSVTRFGLRHVAEKLVLFHKLAVGYMVNLPLLVIRMILWHGMQEGVSIFALKNLLIMGVVTFEVLEELFKKHGHRSRKQKESRKEEEEEEEEGEEEKKEEEGEAIEINTRRT